MPSLLFVCTGNICRSPIASALFQDLVERNQSSQVWRIESAGVWAVAGAPAVENSQIAMERRSLEIMDHRSRRVDAAMLNSYDLILTMEESHKESLLEKYPEVVGRVYLLSEMINRSYDVEDPIGGSIIDFERTAIKLERILTQGFGEILRLAEEGSSLRAYNQIPKGNR